MAIFLKIDGIAGESSDAKHADWIDVETLSFAETNPVASYGSGAGSSRVSVGDVNIQIKTSRAIPRLFEACASGQHFKNAELDFTDSAGVRLQFRLQDLLVASFSLTASGKTEELPLANISLGFARIVITYTHQEVGGSAGGVVQAGCVLVQT
jgi:type VI secretion system secreted protein Hcp